MNHFDLDDSRLVRLAHRVPRLVPREDYGRTFLRIEGEKAGPAMGSVTWVPEGLFVRAECGDCGRHFERVVSLPGIDWDESEATEAELRYLERSMSLVVDRLSDEWYPSHQSECDESEVRLPEELVDLESEYVEEAERALSSGSLVVSQAVLLFESGNRLSVQFQPAIDVKAEDRQESNILVEEGKAGVRHFLRRSDEEPVGAVFVGESWISRPPFEKLFAPPSEDPERDEGIIVQTFTRSAGRTRLYGIEREAQGTKSGPGKLVEELAVPGVGSRFAEGLLAVVEEAEPPERDEQSPIDRVIGGVH